MRALAGALLNADRLGEGAGMGESMDTAVGRDRFCEMFKGRAMVVRELPAGHSRVLANVAAEIAGRDDAALHTRAAYMALFDLLLAHVPPVPPAKLRLLDEAGRPTAAARAIQDYIRASLGKPEFFGAGMYMFHVTGFRPGPACSQSRWSPATGPGLMCGDPIRPTTGTFRSAAVRVCCSARRLSC